MTQQLLLVVAFLAALAALPWFLRWVRSRVGASAVEAGGQSRFISAVAVGPNQRVVTVEVGPENARVWLTLGVGAQSIALLHTAPVGAASSRDEGAVTLPNLRT
jgi:flagellar protein FliO/FliZ